MKQIKKVLSCILCMAVLTGYTMMPMVSNAASQEEGNVVQGGEGGAGEETLDTSDMVMGTDSDITISGYSVSGSKAGDKVTIRFTANAAANSSKRYTITDIQKICPMINESFPFETNDEAYKVVSGTGKSVSCSYTFVARDNLETAYYPVSFMIVYGRKGTGTGTDAYADKDYYVTKNVNVKIQAKRTTTTETTETTASDTDIKLAVASSPKGTYGKNCTVAFTAKSDKCKITSVSPVISENFPFETQGDAYKCITSTGSRSLNCKYQFQVRSDVATGYQTISFNIVYTKNKQVLTATRSINVQLTGKKDNSTQGKGAGKSTPRVMVTGYTTDVEKIVPNGTFRLTLHVKNNAKKAVSNIKFTLSTAEGEFLPISGASTAYVESIAAGESRDLVFDMKAAAGLSSKSYQITVKSEYEDSSAEAYTAEDNISIPVSLEDRISVTEIVPPENLTVGGSSDLTFSINNKGAASLSNVSVKCEGSGFSCEESYVGNIASGATGYATITLTGEEMTPEGEDGNCKIIISYENSSGETNTYEAETTVYVMEESTEEVDEMLEEPVEKSHGSLSLLLFIIVVAVVVTIVVIIRKRKKKRMIQEEEELMDDDLL